MTQNRVRPVFHILFVVLLGLVAWISLIEFLSIDVVMAGDTHAGDIGPADGRVVWGCVGLAAGTECLSGAVVKFSRPAYAVTACSYLGSGVGSGCVLTDGVHTLETFPYFGANIGLVTNTVALSVSVVYTDPQTSQVYRDAEMLMVDPSSFDSNLERRVDITLVGDDIVLQGDGGVVQCADWPDLNHVTCDTGGLVLAPISPLGPVVMPKQANQPGGNIHYVAPGGQCGPVSPCYGSVQEAVDAAAPGDEVRVATGHYTGVTARNGITQHVYVDTSLTIQGGYSTATWQNPDPVANPTTLDALEQGRVIHISGPITVTLSGLNMIQGNALGLGGWRQHPDYDAGGGIYVVTGTLTLEYSQVYSNSAGWGGGIYIYNTVAPQLSNNDFHHNIGGTFTGGILVDHSDGAVVVNNRVAYNVANHVGGGQKRYAGLYVTDSDNIIVSNNLILENWAADECGGLTLRAVDGALIINNQILNNTGNFRHGGGVCLEGTNMFFTDNTVIGNRGALNNAPSVPCGAGGVYVRGGVFTFTNNIVAENHAPVGSGLCVNRATISLTHNTFARNIGSPGIEIVETFGFTTAMALTNNMVVGHSTGISVTSGSTVTLNVTLWGTGAWANGVDWDGAGTIIVGGPHISGDPLFYDPENQDYHITPGSAAADQASPTNITVDIDGQARPQGLASDIGADEVIISTLPVTGAATSLILAPPGLTAWATARFTATIPPGTSVNVSVLNHQDQIIPGYDHIALLDGVNQISLASINPTTYPGLRLQIAMTSTIPGVSPTLTEWLVRWQSPAARAHRADGKLDDGHLHPLVDVQVTLLQNGFPIAETTTNAQGRYRLPAIIPQASEPYQVRVSLKNGTQAQPPFQIRYAPLSTYNGPVVYLQTTTFNLDPNSMFTTRVANFDFGHTTPAYESNVTFPDHLDDIAAIYHYMFLVVTYIHEELGVSLRPLDVNVFASVTGHAYYDRYNSAIVIGAPYSVYEHGGRPMNREWHETFHALMEDAIGTPSGAPYPTPTCVPTQTHAHGGWANCSTADSWVEGWADFWPAVLWEYQGWPEPYLYRMGTAGTVGGNANIEVNWKAWDRACPEPWCPYREEFAVAGIFWDLHDPVSSADGDFITMPASQLWALIGPAQTNPLLDMKDVYDVLVAAAIGSVPSPHYSCLAPQITRLDEIFIEHGFFYDVNDNRAYDCGEEVGRATDSARPGRRNVPLVDAYLAVDFVALPATSVTLTVNTTFPDHPEWDYLYEAILSEPQLNGNRVYLEPPPDWVTATIHISAYTHEGAVSLNPLAITNHDYWALVSQASGFGTTVFSHTFEMGWQKYLPLLFKTP